MNRHNVQLSRGSLARETGVNSETIRYYESIGLMPEPARTSGGHRVYSAAERRRLQFVKRSRELGFSLNEIRELLQLVDGGDYTCKEVRGRAAARLVDINKKIQDLRQMQRTLRSMVSQCDGGLVPECPIVDALNAGW